MSLVTRVLHTALGRLQAYCYGWLFNTRFRQADLLAARRHGQHHLHFARSAAFFRRATGNLVQLAVPVLQMFETAGIATTCQPHTSRGQVTTRVAASLAQRWSTTDYPAYAIRTTRGEASMIDSQFTLVHTRTLVPINTLVL
jgi:hypothetical protein